ncbi:50S ribosomal protein L17 [Candidatus Peregrinibacteria bacterium]|jgi:large subunit ribosomal protein L17|nr:50S ribosomal protein L17 [Candidatus Peregrinibacteria bacterium]MBT7483613.1 50S ribosomal protein L17 [Candidatus Peregrinibacteria bacterium]MBT7702894.1 50S ribosomal protein L17 [Candidatus Peregrinibacteria bacterium]
MRHRSKRRSFGRQTDHQKAMLKNLVTSILLYEKIKTTEAKAKEVAPYVEKLITIAKAGESGKKPKVNVIRALKAATYDENASRKLLEEIAKRYTDRNSGFTRITHLGPRAGDAAPMVQIELV